MSANQIYVTGNAKYVQISSGYAIVNGQILYVAQPFRIQESELVGASVDDTGDYYIVIRPNRRIMEAYYTKNWEYIANKYAYPAGTTFATTTGLPNVDPDEFIIGKILKTKASGNTILSKDGAAETVIKGKRLVDTKDISTRAITAPLMAPGAITGTAVGTDTITGANIAAGAIDWSELSTNVKNGQIPVGGTIEYLGAGDPAGGTWMVPNGRTLSRTVYNELWDVVRNGTTLSPYGNGDGSTTFTLPNDAGLVSVGAGVQSTDNGAGVIVLVNWGRGDVGGARLTTLSLDQIPSHQHPLVTSALWTDGLGTEYPIWSSPPTGGTDSPTIVGIRADSPGPEVGSNSGPMYGKSVGGNVSGVTVGHENMQPYIVYNKLIRVRT